MQTEAIRAWASSHGSEPERGPDRKLSLTSKLLRFEWKGEPAVAVGSEVDGKTRINAVLDGVAWWAARHPSSQTLHLVLGRGDDEEVTDEQRHAIGTLAASLEKGPRIRLWNLRPGGREDEVTPVVAKFTGETPGRWAGYLMTAWNQKPAGLAAEFVELIDHPSVALYPKLSSYTKKSSLGGSMPWQLRLDGLEVGRVGQKSGRLKLDTTNLEAKGPPRVEWLAVVKQKSIAFHNESVSDVVEKIHQLIDKWSVVAKPDRVLNHGQAEHALEAHVLSGRTTLVSESVGKLRLAAPPDGRVLRAAQFPTLWGNVASPARYLDALLADSEGRPWAIELKDQKAGGGNGAYLRAGIGQAVLYRHYIRTVAALDEWFGEALGLRRRECQAALAFPTAMTAVAASIDSHRELAARWGIEVIEFPRPGST